MDENYGGGFDLISADIEKSYIRQNLPIRRQSLIVYHDQLHARSESTRKELWNDMQPLSKLKSVFSRLHPNETLTTSKRSHCNHDVKKKKKKSTGKNHHAGIIYTALLSHVSKDFLKKIQLSTIGEYHDVFDGTTAVNCILDILNTNDRNLALLVGRALENQDLFHHVDYKYKLRDSDTELYQFQFIHHDDTIFLETMSVPSACKTLPINGIFSVLTDCYSPTCTRKSPCYSISCPRMKEKKIFPPILFLLLMIPFLKKKKKKKRSLWRHSVPLNVVLGANNLEQKRQECIYELIYTEEDFTKDMHYVQDFWIEPIRWGDIIPIERRNDFITDVFWNIKDIERVSSALSKDLTSRQDKHTIIPRIGDILLNHVKDFQPFVIYGAHQIIGKHEYELEKKRNVKLQQFAEKLERQPESRRLELNGYLTKPTLRLGRYNLLLNTIHQLTPANHQDYQDLPKVIRTITEFMILLNKKVGLSDNAFHLEQIASKILPTKGLANLDLLDPKRQLIMRGKMKRFNDQTWDIQVFLFDHYLVICKIKYQDGLEYYKVYGKVNL
ncbi:Dbl homology domain-containing protein [Mucor mucedo]|uniref:Dbl homology domain-containing protein n=1 Tax=Mucor mucedo TaxID=29922 RepID=UPI0022211703|nr:Dbl homology domain-containing protein [Mucor mucedo]KAI7890788.1 Dbl homology domain-containing protein [Mucor mucedo]